MPLELLFGGIAVIAVGVGIIVFVLLHGPENAAQVGEKPYASLHHAEDEEGAENSGDSENAENLENPESTENAEVAQMPSDADEATADAPAADETAKEN